MDRFSIGQIFKVRCLRGRAALLPLLITVYTIIAIVILADNLAENYVNDVLYAQYGFRIPALGLVVTFIFTVGLFYNMFFGQKLFVIMEGLLRKIPLIANIYPSAKQLSGLMVDSERRDRFQKTVLVRFPKEGAFSTGCVTNKNVGWLQHDLHEKRYSVFVPFAPAPFSGHILLLSQYRFHDIDMSVDRAINFFVSGGVVYSNDNDQEDGLE